MLCPVVLTFDKETLLIQELKPAFNVNVSSERLIVY